MPSLFSIEVHQDDTSSDTIPSMMSIFSFNLPQGFDTLAAQLDLSFYTTYACNISMHSFQIEKKVNKLAGFVKDRSTAMLQVQSKSLL